MNQNWHTRCCSSAPCSGDVHSYRNRGLITESLQYASNCFEQSIGSNILNTWSWKQLFDLVQRTERPEQRDDAMLSYSRVEYMLSLWLQSHPSDKLCQYPHVQSQKSIVMEGIIWVFTAFWEVLRIRYSRTRRREDGSNI